MWRRNITLAIGEALGDTRVVLLNGPRQSGKSTLAQALGREFGGEYVSLDDPAIFAQAAADPYAFTSQQRSGPLVIDEVQRVPELFQAIKLEVDRDQRPGRFLLTGSANYLTLPRVADSLAGRIEINTLWPLSQGEIAGVVEGFVDTVFTADHLALLPSATSRDDVLQRALTGGFPEVVARARPARAAQWFDSYVVTLLQRDIRDLTNVEAISMFPGLLGLLAARSGSLINMTDFSRSLGLATTTMRRYVDLLVALFLVAPLPAWSANASTRVVRTAKMPLTDSGLMAHLLGQSRDRILGDPNLAGFLLETFVVAEIRKQLTWSSPRPALSFARSYEGREVDIVLDRGAGREVVGIEVKASISISPRDFKGLKWLAEHTGDRFVRGILLYTGEHALQFGEKLWALPVDALWRLGAKPQPDA